MKTTEITQRRFDPREDFNEEDELEYGFNLIGELNDSSYFGEEGEPFIISPNYLFATLMYQGFQAPEIKLYAYSGGQFRIDDDFVRVTHPEKINLLTPEVLFQTRSFIFKDLESDNELIKFANYGSDGTKKLKINFDPEESYLGGYIEVNPEEGFKTYNLPVTFHSQTGHRHRLTCSDAGLVSHGGKFQLTSKTDVIIDAEKIKIEGDVLSNKTFASEAEGISATTRGEMFFVGNQVFINNQ